MSSGRGLSGGVSRCYPFFAEFKECLKTESLVTQDDGTRKWKNNCWKVREDYFECLHAKKEWAMVRKVNEEEKRQAQISANWWSKLAWWRILVGEYGNYTVHQIVFSCITAQTTPYLGEDCSVPYFIHVNLTLLKLSILLQLISFVSLVIFVG